MSDASVDKLISVGTALLMGYAIGSLIVTTIAAFVFWRFWRRL